jgi:Tfp pilus assembly protein FimT
MEFTRSTCDERRGTTGFSLAELSVLLAVIGGLCVLSLPAFLSYYQSAQLRAAASDVASQLNLGRQMAIQRNQNVCVSIGSTALQYYLGSCAGTLLLGVTTDSYGSAAAHDGVTLTTSANPVFNNLGAATPAATITVTQGGRTLSVTVSAAGRVTIGP